MIGWGNGRYYIYIYIHQKKYIQDINTQTYQALLIPDQFFLNSVSDYIYQDCYQTCKHGFVILGMDVFVIFLGQNVGFFVWIHFLNPETLTKYV